MRSGRGEPTCEFVVVLHTPETAPCRRTRPNPQDTDREAMHLAETTDVSPKQAKDLLREHGGDKKKAAEKAKNFKAEG